jgi:hypothetical protein
MTSHPLNRDATLLPTPKGICLDGQVCRASPDLAIDVQIEDSRVERAILRWRDGLTRVSVGPGAPGRTTVRLAVDGAGITHPQGYRLRVRPRDIEVIGGSVSGCFHGVQTLTQLTRFSTGEVPCGTVVDEPDFATRGLLLDITRGKVPTLGTLQRMADRLAALKINQLQLYIEHAFVFAFDPDIADADSALTADEVRELDAYCRERFIDLVPALATLGHMGRILSMPKYRQLAEVEPTQTWETMSWPQRARGFTLNVANERAHELVRRMWSDVLDAFSGPIVNICGDEPWDLGKGKNRDRFAITSVGEAYLDHIVRTHAICASQTVRSAGRRTQAWSDVVRNHPAMLGRLPRELTVLHWGYDDRADYDGTAAFVNAGVDTMVCPGTSGWKRIINAMGLAERNISTFAAAGRKYGASGLLNTDWGDHGHFNQLACSWHGIALGAALSWNANDCTGAEFDERFARVVVGVGDATAVRLLREASRIADRCETWRLMWLPLREIVDDPTLPSVDEADQSADASRQALRRLESMDRAHVTDFRDLDEWIVACRFCELFADKVRLAHQLRAASSSTRTFGSGSRAAAERQFADHIAHATESYAACWRARNKPSGLPDVVAALAATARTLRPAELANHAAR